jgi:hypothetical protein
MKIIDVVNEDYVFNNYMGQLWMFFWSRFKKKREGA